MCQSHRITMCYLMSYRVVSRCTNSHRLTPRPLFTSHCIALLHTVSHSLALLCVALHRITSYRIISHGKEKERGGMVQSRKAKNVVKQARSEWEMMKAEAARTDSTRKKSEKSWRKRRQGVEVLGYYTMEGIGRCSGQYKIRITAKDKRHHTSVCTDRINRRT